MSGRLIIVIGPQGSGKSTQAKLLAEHLELPLFSSGQEIRRYAKTKQTDQAKELQNLLNQGQLVPNQVLQTLLEEFISDHNCQTGLISDGFPRSLDQCPLIEKLAQKNSWKVIGIFVDLSHQSAVDRLLKRAASQPERDDDRLKIIEHRLAIFEQETRPVIDYLKEQHRLIEVNGEGSIDSIKEAIISELND